MKMHMKNRNLPFRRILPIMRLGGELLLFTTATDDLSESESYASNRINLKNMVDRIRNIVNKNTPVFGREKNLWLE